MFRRSPEWFKTWVQDTFAPVVLVRVSPDAEDSALKNNLSFADLLRPYQDINKTLTIPRIAREHETYTISSFKLRFRTIDELAPPTAAERSSLFGECVQQPIEDVSDAALPAANLRVMSAKTGIDDKSSLLSLSSSSNKDKDADNTMPNVRGDEEYTPWYDAVREEVPLSIRCSAHECFEHPVACINVVSTRNPDPVATLRSLSFRRSALPESIRNYPVDDDILQCYVLLHDVHNNPQETINVNNKLEPIKEAFGASVCRVLHINSRKPGMDGVEGDIWTPHMPRSRQFLRKNLNRQEQDSSINKSREQQQQQQQQDDILLPGLVDSEDKDNTNNVNDNDNSQNSSRSIAKLGEHLCPREDLTYFSNFVTEFLAPQIVTRMTEKMRHTYVNIVSKRGLRNRMLGWFRKPSRDEEAEAVRNNFRIRQLADYAFMLRDYDLAQTNYNLVASDYKNKDAQMYAGALEMASLVSFVSEDKMRDADLDAAVQQYSSDTDVGMHALRSSMFLAALHVVSGDLLRAATVYIRAAEHAQRVLKDSLVPALLLEQTAFCHLMQGEGDGINDGGLLSGIVTASSSSFSLSSSSSGRKIGQYRKYGLYLVLAGYRYSVAGQVRHSYRCYAAAMPIYRGRGWRQVDDHINITLGRLNAHMNRLSEAVHFLHELVTSCHQPADTQSVLFDDFVETAHRYLTAMDSPHLDPLRIPVMHDNTLEIVLSDNPPPSGSPWRVLEDSLLRTVRPDHVASWARSFASVPRENHTAVGEPVYVEVDVHNPLKIPILLSQLQLTASFTPRGHDTSHDNGYGDRDGDRSGMHRGKDNVGGTNDGTTGSLTHSPSLPAFPSQHYPKVSSPSPSSSREHSPVQSQMRSSVSAAQLKEDNKVDDYDDDDPWSMFGGNTPQDSNGNLDEQLSVKCTPVDVLLEASETKRVRLCLTPVHEGRLEITGAQWMLGERICGRHRFQIHGPRLNKSKQQRSGRKYAEDRRLHLSVTPPMPLLSFRISGMPQQLWHGETVQATMEIANTGRLPLKNLQLKASHPSFIAIGDPYQPSADNNMSSPSFPPPSSSLSSSSSSSSLSFEQQVSVPSRMTTDPLSIIRIPLSHNNNNNMLSPNSSIRIPLYVRGAVPGVHDIRFLFYYESDQPSTDMPYRVHRHVTPLHVAEALVLRTVPRAAATPKQDIILGMEVRNRRRSSVSIRQISAISSSWDLQLVSDLSGSDDGADTVTVAPDVVTTLYFKVRQRKHQEHEQEDQHTPSASWSKETDHRQSVDSSLPDLNVRTLATTTISSSNAELTDITTHPFLEFLFRTAATMPLPRGRGGGGDGRMRTRCSLLPCYVPRTRTVPSEPDSAPTSARGTPRHHRGIMGSQDVGGLPEEEERDIEDMFPFVREKEGLALAMLWRSEDGRIGQNILPHVSFLHGAVVQPHHSIGLPAPPPVKVNLRYDSNINHSFKSQPMCVTQVVFTLCNVSVETPISVTIELISPLTAKDPSARPPNIPFQWLGTTKISFTGVASGSSVEIPVNVALFSPGVYNLASYRLWWTVPEQRGRQPTLLKPVKSQHLLYVTAAN